MAVTYPLDLVRTRMTVEDNAKFMTILQTQGQKGWFKGLNLALAEVVPNIALNYLLFESIKARLFRNADNWIKSASAVVSSSISAAISCTINYPLVVIRRRLQVLPVPPEKSIRFMSKKLWQQHGVRGFFVGIVPFYLQIVPQIAVSFSVFEESKRYFQQINKLDFGRETS